MTDHNIVEALQIFSKNSSSAVEGALIVSRIVNPATDTDWCWEQLRKLAARIPADASPEVVAESLRGEGFAGSTAYYKSENSALQHVLKTREGIPISLGMVLLGVAEKLGMPAHGVNFPSHFMVSVQDRLLDPFSMTLVDETECLRWLAEQHLSAEQGLQVATPATVVLRMLNNLSQLANARDDKARALELSDYKLAVSPHPFYVYLERIDLWLGLGVTEMARLELEAAAALAPDETSRARLLEKLAGISQQQPMLH